MTSEKSSIKAKLLLFNPNKQYCFSAEKWPLNLTEIRISIIFFLIRCLFILQVLSCTVWKAKILKFWTHFASEPQMDKLR